MSTTTIPAKKVALMGGPCTRKTTMVTAVGEQPHVRTVPEQAREHFDSVSFAERHTLAAQKELAERIISIERETAENGGVLLCDRSVLDGVAYLRVAGRSAHAEELFEHVSFWLPTYDRFVLSDPAGIPFQNDGVRVETPEFRDELHREFLAMFEELEIEYELLQGTPAERVCRVTEMLSD